MVSQVEDHFLVKVPIEFRILKELQFEAMFTGDSTSNRETQPMVCAHVFP